jgi:hypothetical protein
MYEVWDQSVCFGVSEDSSGRLLYEVWRLDNGVTGWISRRIPLFVHSGGVWEDITLLSRLFECFSLQGGLGKYCSSGLLSKAGIYHPKILHQEISSSWKLMC